MKRRTAKRIATLALLVGGCTEATPPEIAPRSATGATAGLDERFSELHEDYLEASRDYVPRLRATLRHGRRLLPSECLAAQSQLVSFGAQHGYDGLEPLWLLYQDCVSTAPIFAVGLARAANYADFQAGLSFELSDPHPQVYARVSHYNSRIDRGIRGDALRSVLEGHAAMGMAGSAVSLHGLLDTPSIQAGLCELPTRLDQSGQIANPELLRLATCAAGVGSNLHDACGELFGNSPAGVLAIPDLSLADNGRLEGLCDNLAGSTGASTGGTDMLDGFATDWCMGEAGGRVSAEEVPGLIMDCYFGNDGASPVADGGVTSANFDTFLGEIVNWRGAGHDYATLTTPDGHYQAVGGTPEEARAELRNQLSADPSSGASTDENGSVHINRNTPNAAGGTDSFQSSSNPDGSSSSLRQSTNGDNQTTSSRRTERGADGSTKTTNESYEYNDAKDLTKKTSNTQTRKPDGSSSSTSKTESYGYDADGEPTTKTVTETTTTTDADGNTTTTTKTTTYDGDDNIISESSSPPASTTTPGTEGAYDPLNPACQELEALGIGHGSRSEMFDELYDRGSGPAPEEVYPSPEDDSEWEDAPNCGAVGLGGHGQQPHCASPVMCLEGTALGEDCLCGAMEVGAAPPARGCIEAVCADGTVPVPIGGVGCMCESEGSSEPPVPPPHPFALAEATEEMVWNRAGREIIVTPQMQDDFFEGKGGPAH